MTLKPKVTEAGREASAKTRKEAADKFARETMTNIAGEGCGGLSLNEIARRLNAAGYPGPGGKRGTWTARAVKNAQDRHAALLKAQWAKWNAEPKVFERQYCAEDGTIKTYEVKSDLSDEEVKECMAKLNASWRERTQEETLKFLYELYELDNKIRGGDGLMPLSFEEWCFIDYCGEFGPMACRTHPEEWRRADLLRRRKKDSSLKRRR